MSHKGYIPRAQGNFQYSVFLDTLCLCLFGACHDDVTLSYGGTCRSGVDQS